MKHNPLLTLQKSEVTLITIAKEFSKENDMKFYDLLEKNIDEHKW